MANVMHSLETGQYVPDTGGREMGLQGKFSFGQPGESCRQGANNGGKLVVQPKRMMVQRRAQPLTGDSVTYGDSIRDSRGGKKENKTGLPDRLKGGIENLSGYSMDDVRVHYNSSKPAQLQALAYAQGREIHVGPGQEKHLPHEAWHVVQQMQGRVRPTMEDNRESINTEEGLEREARVMGARAMQCGAPKNLMANEDRRQRQVDVGEGGVELKSAKRHNPTNKNAVQNRPIQLADGVYDSVKNRRFYYISKLYDKTTLALGAIVTVFSIITGVFRALELKEHAEEKASTTFPTAAPKDMRENEVKAGTANMFYVGMWITLSGAILSLFALLGWIYKIWNKIKRTPTIEEDHIGQINNVIKKAKELKRVEVSLLSNEERLKDNRRVSHLLEQADKMKSKWDEIRTDYDNEARTKIGPTNRVVSAYKRAMAGYFEGEEAEDLGALEQMDLNEAVERIGDLIYRMRDELKDEFLSQSNSETSSLESPTNPLSIMFEIGD
ncbi:MAG: DUF4157 domain-containing protein [Moorea sp. SIO4G3]|nr:DUF4157 domain-containing protein [Moorena sp. SIO4G3]